MARPPIYRLLFVVGREREPLYDSLRRTFDGDDTVQVVLDRRVGERRRQESTPRAGERRRSDRRAQRDSDALLRARGYTLVDVVTLSLRTLRDARATMCPWLMSLRFEIENLSSGLTQVSAIWMAFVCAPIETACSLLVPAASTSLKVCGCVWQVRAAPIE